jgi:hypothetical protein
VVESCRGLPTEFRGQQNRFAALSVRHEVERRILDRFAHPHSVAQRGEVRQRYLALDVAF